MKAEDEIAMNKTKILILGGTGMLGSMVAEYLGGEPQFEVAATTRIENAPGGSANTAGLRWHSFDASAEAEPPDFFAHADWIINCIGIIKPLIHDDNAIEVERALLINALFPHRLARWTAGRSRVLQIATDCVYSGSKGRYVETDVHDALDVYGKTKSIGEVYADHVHHLRCSIIGPEAKSPKSLLEWFLGQSAGASVNGFTNHRWNGVTTLHFAKLCAGIIKRELDLPHLQHVIPTADLTKCEMLKNFSSCYGRADIVVKPAEAATIIDRTLATNDERVNRKLWEAAGYETPPSVPQMIRELAAFDYRMKEKVNGIAA